MGEFINLIRNRRLLLIMWAGFVMTFILAGSVLAPNVRFSGFSLNQGNITALNALFQPSGYDDMGAWTGIGSGLIFSASDTFCRGPRVCFNIQAPVGTISLPYADPMARFAGTNLNYAADEPLAFSSADGVAEISIESESHPNPGVRFSGTNITMQTPDGPVELLIQPEQLEIKNARQTIILVPSDGEWLWMIEYADGQRSNPFPFTVQ